jgi:hypothetical protein
MKYYLWLGLLLIFLLPTSSVLACSGWSGFHDNLDALNSTEFFVEATVIDVDDSGQNAIFRVERYIKGSGRAYVAVLGYSPSYYFARERHYDTGCGFPINEGWDRGDRGFFTLLSLENGAFMMTDTHILIEHGRVYINDYDLGEMNLSLDEFENLIDSIIGETVDFIPNGAGRSRNYPLIRPLLITTESGRHYELKLDRSLREMDFTSEAFAVSPDGTHGAYYVDENTITFGMCGWGCSTQGVFVPQYRNGNSDFMYPRIAGQQVAFSPNGNFVAVWNETSLSLHLFDTQERADRGYWMGIQQLGSVEFVDTLPSSIRQVKWTNDSSTVAFGDAAGIWRWNIYTMAEPELLVAADALVGLQLDTLPEVPQLLDISFSGRYLRYGTANSWTLFDTLTGESFVNALVTPDELNLAFINVEAPNGVAGFNQLQGQSETYHCSIPLYLSCPIVVAQAGEIVSFAWSFDSLDILACDEINHNCALGRYNWSISSPRIYSEGFTWELGWAESMIYYELSRYWGQLFITGDYTFMLNYNPMDEFETYYPELYDLSSQLDSPIIHIEWGQSIFYEERS